MSRSFTESNKSRTAQSGQHRALHIVVAALIFVAAGLFMVSWVASADAPARSVDALRSIVPSEEPPTQVPPTEVPPTEVPPTEVPPTEVPPTSIVPTTMPPTRVPPSATPKPVLPKTGAEVDAPTAQEDNGLGTLLIVGLGVALVAGGVMLSRASNTRKSDSA
jgi:flagellar basal body-associated protein FliL